MIFYLNLFLRRWEGYEDDGILIKQEHILRYYEGRRVSGKNRMLLQLVLR